MTPSSMRLALCSVLLVLVGCSTSGPRPASKSFWGSEATYAPGWRRLGEVTQRAATDPHVWVPLVGAGLFALGNADESVSEWAVEEMPLFGDIQDAKDASDALLGISVASALGTALLAPSGADFGETVRNKSKGLVVTLAAAAVNDRVTDVLKDAVGRERPDGQSERSFPSRHTSSASVASTLAVRNLEYLDLSERQRDWLGAALYANAALTGWARIEGQRHFPSDVLVGYALGHFIGVIANDAFIAPLSNNRVALQLSGDGDAVRVGIVFR